MSPDVPISAIAFELAPDCGLLFIHIHVTGRDLGKILELAARETNHPQSLFVDDDLPWYGDFDREMTILGETARTKGKEGVILFVCACGYAGCGCTLVDVAVESAIITLSNFRTARAPQQPVDAGPFRFARKQFEAAVQKLTEQASAWPPPPLGTHPERRVLLTPPPSG